MMPDLVPAIWHGPFEGDRGPGLPPVKIGDVVDVSPDMLESGHWTAVSDAPAADAAITSTPASAPVGTVPVRPGVPAADLPGGDA